MKNEGFYRRNGKKVYIKKPEYNEMAYISELWGDKATMENIGGVFNFGKERWEPFYRKMVSPTDGRNFYCLIYNNRDIKVGEVSFHGYDPVTRTARFNIKVQAKYRGLGYGSEATSLLLEYYFQDFGGNIIMDTIKDEMGIKIAKKLNFEEVSKMKDERTFRITKEKFFNNGKGIKTHVEILVLEEMNLLDYTMPFEIFKKANDILEKEVFNVYGVSFVDEIKTNIGIKVEIPKGNRAHQEPNIIIIPGGMDSKENSKKIIDYILETYNECDYICAFNEGITYLVKCRELTGIVVPGGDWLGTLDEEEIRPLRIVNKNYADNGKVMLSTNPMGNLELCLNLIKKVCGRELEEKVSKVLGLR